MRASFLGGRRQRPLPVLLVQQGQKAGEAAYAHGQPRRSDGMHQLSLAQILSYFRQNVEQKACTHATQNHLLDAAETEEPQGDGRCQHHHGSQQKWLREKLVVLQPVPGGRESRAFRRPDVARELPKRHSLRCGEAIADLSRRKAGREEEAVLINRRTVEGVPARRFEQPASLLERRLARFDSLLEPIVGIESEYGQPGQPHPLLFAAGGIDDGTAVAVHLIDPEAGRVLYAAAGGGAEQ